MTTYKYICNVCNVNFDTAENAASHITKIKHRKKTEELILSNTKLSNDKKETLKLEFTKNDLVSEKDLYYSKLLKIDNKTESRKYTYFCKFCSRQFVKKESLLNHMNKTCKVKKDKTINHAELQKLQCDDDQQVKISFIEEQGVKMKLEEMMHENEVIHPFQDDNYVDSDDDQDCCVYENNSYGCVGANNIPPDPTMVNPENNNYPNELPEIKDEEKEDYEEFQKIMYLASLQGLNEEEQMYFVYQYQRKKRQEELSEIKYYYMMIRREEERQRISNAQKVALFSVNEAKRVLKKIREEVSTLALLNKNTLRLTNADIKQQQEKQKEMCQEVDDKYSLKNMKVKVRKNKKFHDNNYDLPEDNSIEELIDKSLEPEDMPNKPEEMISKDLANILYENRTPEVEDIYNEIDNLYRDNFDIFNLYIKRNFIKFQHLFEDVFVF